MQTILRSATTEVKIKTDGSFIMIGEKINPTGRKKLAEALQQRNFDYVRELALKQVEFGADVLDVNVGVPGIDDVALIPDVIKVISETVKVPLCIDSPNAKVLEAALKVAPGKVLVNSTNGEEKTLSAVLPLVKEYGAAVIGLTMDDNGIPATPEERLKIAAKIIERAMQLGIPIEDVVIDPLVMTVGADQNAGAITLKTIELVRIEFGVNMNLGASNVSFGLPDRHTLNQAFLSLAMGAGATCAITDPIKLGATIRATDLIRGRDNYAKAYIKYCRAHPLEGK
ncbi:MAG: dihydropteroate synthase [Thermoflexales bacterium]|nr:dihydropteroate synthase [Thermoflexales bacterium]